MKTGNLTLIGEYSVVSVDNNANAEVLLHPNREWVYVSSRGVGLVSVFQLNKTEPVLSKVQEFRIQGTWPRSMALSGAGDVLAVADQMGDTIQLLKIDPNNGQLMMEFHAQQMISTPHQPSFVSFLN